MLDHPAGSVRREVNTTAGWEAYARLRKAINLLLVIIAIDLNADEIEYDDEILWQRIADAAKVSSPSPATIELVRSLYATWLVMRDAGRDALAQYESSDRVARLPER